MKAVKLIYFEGCPNAKNARAVLLASGTPFDVIKQDETSEDSPFRGYSSPTILNGDEIIFGQKIDRKSSACSAEILDEQMIKKKLQIGSEYLGEKPKKNGILAAIGSFGSALTVGLCPICIPAIGAFLSSIGLGFLVKETVLMPLLFVFLTVTMAGLLWSYFKEHHNTGPVVVGALAAVFLYVGRYVYVGGVINSVFMYGGIGAIILVSLWNLRLRKRIQCPSCVN